jgi:cyclopropane fatty-acyl-phospholipid synthase-like methyltransferase
VEHRQAIQYWQEMARNNPDEKSVKINPENDYTAFDAEFIMMYANKDSEVLDLASGTGLAINKYYDRVGHIDAVELFPEFTKFIVQSPNVKIYNQSIEDFLPEKGYDIVSMFGVVQYFSEEEVAALYSKYKTALNPGGRLIVKNQFGVEGDVEVSGVSQELNKEYLSQYRHIEKEVSILKSVGFEEVDVIDIYPPEANRWSNTHFYAIVATS